MKIVEVFDFSDGLRGAREAFGGRLGGSWRCPGGVREASWEGVGRSWGDLGATFEQSDFESIF